MNPTKRGSSLLPIYVSEPITRCPPREKARIRNLVLRMADALAEPPYLLKLYIPSLVSSPEIRGKMKPEHVYLLDRIRVVEAAFMLVVADHSSFGVGGEVEMATSLGKPVVFFSRHEAPSRFLLGTPSNVVRSLTGQEFLPYRDWSDLKKGLLPLVQRLLEDLQKSPSEGFAFRNVGLRMRELRLRKGLNIEELASRTGLRAESLRILETPFEEIRRELSIYDREGDLRLAELQLNAHQLEQLTGLGLAALEKIAFALDVGLKQLIGEGGQRPPDPSQQVGHELLELERARSHCLEIFARQYDLTYREFEKLRERLVFQALETADWQERTHLKSISEKEFKNALAAIRT